MDLELRTDDPIPAMVTTYQLSITHYNKQLMELLAKSIERNSGGLDIKLFELTICNDEVVDRKKVKL